MSESFDAFRYVRYMRSRGLWIAGSCGVAVVLALATSIMLPREYTAVARMVIEPPAGADPRNAMAVSPIYLESLRTYEHFATGDSLFQKAVERFGLQSEGGRPIESLKKRILRVEIIRNTRIMEISATLPDARKAQALAQYLAEATAEVNRTLIAEGNQELLQSIERQSAETRAHLDELDAAWSHMLTAEPVQELASAQENAAMLRSDLEEQIVNADVQASEAAESTRHSRAAELRRQVEILDRQTTEREKLLAERTAHRDTLDTERRATQTALTALEGRLREARSDAGYRGERLKIIDPGIVPERPSSPNVPLNLVGALLLGAVLPVLYFTLEMAWQEQRSGSRRTVFHE